MHRHSIQKQNTPLGPTNRGCSISLHASGQHSSASNIFSRKISTSSVKDYVDIDKLIGEIKITPAKSCQQQIIKAIFKSLQQLKCNSTIVDEIKTMELLLESISKKLLSNALANTRSKHRTIQPQKTNSHNKNNSISPIKLFEDATSRILYTNFTLKEFDQSQKQEADNLRTPAKKVNNDEQEENQQMEKLNNEIQLLQKMLRRKGINNDCAAKCKINEQFASSNKSKFIANQNQTALPKRIMPPSIKGLDTAPPKPTFIMLDRKTVRKGCEINFR